MDYETILQLVKINLQISASALDPLLEGFITTAEQAIENEGITLKPLDDYDQMLVVQYASWLYDKRKENGPMPRSLRWQLNNRLLTEKAGE